MNQASPAAMNIISQGEGFLAGGDLTQALRCAVALLQQNPHAKEGYALAGKVMQAGGDWARAEAYYLQALYLDTYDSAAQQAFMQHYLAQDLRGYEQALRQQIEKTPNHSFALDVLTDYYWSNQQWPQLYAMVEAARAQTDVSPYIKEKLSILSLLGQYLEGSPISLAVINQYMAGFVGKVDEAGHIQSIKQLDGSRRFFKFFVQLLAYKHAHPESYQNTSKHTLYCVGESHAFGMAHMHVTLNGAAHHCEVRCVTGLKAHHFAQSNGDITAAMGRQYVNHALSTIPQSSKVLVAVGEIDCRINEGILHAMHRHNKPLEQTVARTVRQYVEALRAMNAPYHHRLMLCTVPPLSQRVQEVYEKRNDAEALKNIPKLKEIIQRFNHHLNAQAKTHGFQVVDTYTDFIAGNGFANPDIHVDETHLRPDVVAKALAALN